MGFGNPVVLLLLAAVPVVGLLLWMGSRRRSRHAVRFAAADVLADLDPSPRWRRITPAVILLVSLSLAVVAAARPYRIDRVPREEATIVFTLDVSLSMEADDVPPSRLDAAKAAAIDALDRLPDEVRAGVVSFAGTAFPEALPSTDHEGAIAAVNALELREGTSAGDGIIASLQVLGLDDTNDDSPVAPDGSSTTPEGTPEDPGAQEDPDEPANAIVLLSDGDTQMGVDPIVAAQQAADAGVPVHTVAFGTDDAVIDVGGRPIPVSVDEAELQAIADTTGGEFFRALDADSLARVFDTLGRQIGLEEVERDITPTVAVVAGLLLTAALALSVLWFGRLL